MTITAADRERIRAAVNLKAREDLKASRCLGCGERLPEHASSRYCSAARKNAWMAGWDDE